jgi:hypothetical protein
MPKSSEITIKECHDCGQTGKLIITILRIASYFLISIKVQNGVQLIMVYFYVMNVVVFI